MQNTNFKVGGRQPITLDRLVRGTIAILLIVGVGLSIYYLSSVLIPFFVAWVVAYLLYPWYVFAKSLPIAQQVVGYHHYAHYYVRGISRLLLYCGTTHDRRNGSP